VVVVYPPVSTNQKCSSRLARQEAVPGPHQTLLLLLLILCDSTGSCVFSQRNGDDETPLFSWAGRVAAAFYLYQMGFMERSQLSIICTLSEVTLVLYMGGCADYNNIIV